MTTGGQKLDGCGLCRWVQAARHGARYLLEGPGNGETDCLRTALEHGMVRLETGSGGAVAAVRIDEWRKL